ncbi:hypothetical protein GOP47_0017951 [Adiantum capillus-veneris]|uniref:CDP-diacylglycerol--glycerol-3-phosphate 3-phosphatidyltransferase n=1 Tax=Adiantum capillus-veneris TaxID=13818 RepID=A0A9D4UGC4_ADICA|nr:hypothetical protein GOP47_0017951 [Adiantum capillus-veneris]
MVPTPGRRALLCKNAGHASATANDCDKRQCATLLSRNGSDGHGRLTCPLGEPSCVPRNKVLTLPTMLTLGRIAAIPILLFAFYSRASWAPTAVACIFLLAAITDWLDGFLARKMGLHSSFGAFLDPVADKLMVATTLVLLCTKPLHISWASDTPWLIPLPSTAIIGREITMSAVREWAASQGEILQSAVAVNKLGKVKTAFQMAALTVLLVTRSGSEAGSASVLMAIGVGLLYISAMLAVWSLFVYMKAIWGVLVR